MINLELIDSNVNHEIAMNLRQIETFRYVMQTGSIKGAAELMHISSPAASKLLSAGERRAGLVLFERAKGRLVPTPEARALHEEVERLWGRLDLVNGLIHELAHPTQGALNLAISPNLGTTLVPQAVTALLEHVPHATVKVELLIPHLLVQSLVDGIAHVGLSLSPVDHPTLKVLRRRPMRLVCVMPQGHPLSKKSVVRPADLVGRSVVGFPLAVNYGISERDLYGAFAGKVKPQLDVRSGQTACWFSLAGAGVAIVDELTVIGNAFPELVVRPYQCSAKLALHLVHRTDRPLSRVAATFIETFEDTLASLKAQT